VRYALRQAATPRAIDALAWLLAAERGFGGKRGCVVKHPDMARMLGCSARSAGTAMRELVDLGLVDQRPHFVPADDPKDDTDETIDDKSRHKRWHERTPAYQTTALCREVVSRRETRIGRRKSRGSVLVGKDFQPPESAANPSGSHTKCVQGRGRPEQAFADAVLESRKAPTASPPVAVLRGPVGPGTGALLRHEVAGQKLLAQRSRGTVPTREEREHAQSLDGILAGAWAAFAEHEKRGGGGDAAS
jgi:hypothetical protein